MHKICTRNTTFAFNNKHFGKRIGIMKYKEVLYYVTYRKFEKRLLQ